MNEAKCTVDVLYCDSLEYPEARQHFEMGTEDITMHPTGGGGTDFAPAIEAAKEFEPDCIIYLTDGECDSFGDTSVPVLWGLTIKNNNFKPPFGEAIFMDFDEENKKAA